MRISKIMEKKNIKSLILKLLKNLKIKKNKTKK